MISLQLKKGTFKFMHYKLKFLEKFATIKSGLVVQSTDIFCTFLSQTRFLHRVLSAKVLLVHPKWEIHIGAVLKCSFTLHVKTALV